MNKKSVKDQLKGLDPKVEGDKLQRALNEISTFIPDCIKRHNVLPVRDEQVVGIITLLLAKETLAVAQKQNLSIATAVANVTNLFEHCITNFVSALVMQQDKEK